MRAASDGSIAEVVHGTRHCVCLVVGDGLILKTDEIANQAEFNLVSDQIDHYHCVVPHRVLHIHRAINDDLGKRRSESCVVRGVAPTNAVLEPRQPVDGAVRGIIIVNITTEVDVAVCVELRSGPVSLPFIHHHNGKSFEVMFRICLHHVTSGGLECDGLVDLLEVCWVLGQVDV